MEEGIGSGNQRGGSVRRTWPDIAGFEDGERGPWTKECWWILQAGKHKETDPGLEPIERNAALKTLIFSPVRLIMSTLFLWLRRFSSLAVWDQALFTGKYSFESFWMVSPSLGEFPLTHSWSILLNTKVVGPSTDLRALFSLCMSLLFSNHFLSMPATLFSLDAQLCLLKWGGAVGSAFVSPPYTVAWKLKILSGIAEGSSLYHFSRIICLCCLLSSVLKYYFIYFCFSPHF